MQTHSRRRSHRLETLTIVLLTMVAAPLPAAAHVTVRPTESRGSAEETYTVRVPTEGQVATVSVEVQIPDGMTVITIAKLDDARHEETKAGDRITAIKWIKEIPPKQSAEFVFRAKNPATGEITWKARQQFADGTSREWTPITKLVSR